ncbi:MAG: 5'-nucleotidase C-terminal domain-containing protein [Acidobacteriota bacterium]
MSIKLVINGCPLEIFEGATVGDAVRKFSPEVFRIVEHGDTDVTDMDGNKYYLSGELTGGEVFRIEKNTHQESKMIKSKNLIIISIMVILSLLVLGIFLTGETENETRITIFHINDIHGNIDNFGKISHIVDLERAKNPNVFLVHAGDNFSGNPVVDQYEPKGEPLLMLMNKLKFSAGVIGNHDFDYGKKILKSFIERAKFPMLCSNIKTNDPDFPQPVPYKTFHLEGGVEMILLGLIQTEDHSGLPSTLPDNVKNLKFFKGTEFATKFRHLKKKNNILIALSHLGYGEDKKLARNMKEIDVIIGGHSHTLLENPTLENGVLIAQAGAQLDYLGRIDVIVKGGRIIEKKGLVVDLNKRNKSNKEIDKLIRDFNNKGSLNKVLADIGTTITGRHDLGLMVTDAVREDLGLDMIFYNKGGIRINKLSGEVKAKDIYTMHPFGNYIVEMRMDTSEIKDLIKNDYEGHRGLDIIPSGLTYRVTRDLNKKVHKVEIFDLDGYPIPEGKKFRVGMNNYIVSSYKFTHKDPGRSTNSKTVDIMLRFFSKLKKKLNYSGRVRSEEKIVYTGKTEKFAVADTDIFTAGKKFYKNSPSGNLAADAMRAATEADLAFYPTRLLRTDLTIKKGHNIYKEALPDLYNFLRQSKVIKVKMTGRQIIEFIFEQSSRKNNIDVQISGGTYRILYNKARMVNKIELFINNKAVDTENIFTAAILEYEFNQFYSLKKSGIKIEGRSMELEKALQQYLTDRKTIGEETSAIRITLLPKGRK